jgi:hypothetical protein
MRPGAGSISVTGRRAGDMVPGMVGTKFGVVRM